MKDTLIRVRVTFVALLCILGGCLAAPEDMVDSPPPKETSSVSQAVEYYVNPAYIRWGDWSILAPTATASVSVQSDAAITRSSTGDLDVFYVGGADRQLVHLRRGSSGTWSSELLGNYDGPLQGGPAAVAWELPPDASGAVRRGLSVVVRSNLNNVLYRQFEGTAWSPWRSIQGGTYDRPAIAYASPSAGRLPRLGVFVRGTDNRLWWTSSTGPAVGTFGGWSQVDNTILYSAPGAASMSNDGFNIIARGPNAELRHIYWYDGAWPYANRWESLDGALLQGAPGVTSSRPGFLEIFAQGTDRGLWSKSWGAAGWTSWNGGMASACMWHQPLSSTENTHWSGSTPAVVGSGGFLSLVIRGNDGNLWFRGQVLDERFNPSNLYGVGTSVGNGLAPPTCSCGASSQECCVLTPCNNDPHLVCNPRPAPANPRNVCDVCGISGAQCCPGSTCDGGLTCWGGRCLPCGNRGQGCCDGTSCGGGLVCQNGQCQCGGSGQPCCAGAACNAGFACQSGQCVACGGNGQTCCGGSACGGGLTCQNGRCATPPQVCGTEGQLCCTGAGQSPCLAGTTCIGGTCRTCNIEGGPCCPPAYYGGASYCLGMSCHPDTLRCANCGTYGRSCCLTLAGVSCADGLRCSVSGDGSSVCW